MLLTMIGAITAGETKTPIKLTGGHAGDYTFDQEEANVTIEPLGTSTLEDLYSAKFTVKNSQTNIFQYKPLEVGDYQKIVIKFAEPVPEGWAYVYEGGLPPSIPTGATELEIPLNGTALPDFTIFNWNASEEGLSISISEIYFYKKEMDVNEGTVIQEIDYSEQASYPYYDYEGNRPDGATYGLEDGALVINNTKDDGNQWDLQPFILDWFSMKKSYDYIVKITMKASVAGNADVQIGTWSSSMKKNMTFKDDYTTYTVEFPNSTVESNKNDVHVLFQCRKTIGTFYITKVQVIEIAPDDPLLTYKEDLQAAIAAGKAQNPFAKTEESLATLTSAIEAGETALADADATVKSLTGAATAITNAINGLKLQDGYTNLTTDMFKTWTGHDAAEGTVNTGCVYNLNKSTDLPFGLSTVDWLNYANLSEYSTLSVIASAGAPRFCFNRIENGGQDNDNEADSKMIDIPNKAWGTTAYRTVDGNVHTIDLAKMTSDRGFADLHCIKDVNWAKVTVTDMLLYRTLTISDAGMASFGSSDKTAKMNGATVYTATYTDGYVQLTEVSDATVPAGVGVLVEGSGEIVPTFDVEAGNVTSDLKVSNGTVSGDDIYVLAKKNDVLGFYKLASTDKVPAGKAYLQIAASSREFIPINSEATAIKTIETAKANGTIYNLAGQQVKNAQKGVFVIDGKKVIK